MSCAVITIAVDDLTVEPLGVKEAAVMALEPLGGSVHVLQVEVREPEQLGLGGFAPASQPAPRPAARRAAPPGGQAPARDAPVRLRQTSSRAMACCFNCVHHKKDRGRDAHGRLYWGICKETGRPVYELKAQCAAWWEAT